MSDEILLELEHRPVPIRILRSRRRQRTLALQVRPDGTALVRAPMAAGRWEIEAFITGRREWLRRALDAVEEALVPAPIRPEDGARLPLLGGHVRLRVVETAGGRSERWRVGDRLTLTTTPGRRGRLGDRIRAWYRNEATRIIPERIEAFRDALDIPAGRIRRIRYGRPATRWGSCNHDRGFLNFNWRIVQAEPELVDYLVVHELAHLHVPNHSHRFWARVRAVLPDSEDLRRRLRAFHPARITDAPAS